MKKICKFCGKEFEARSHKDYCSKECYRQVINLQNKEKRRKERENIEKICPYCGISFIPKRKSQIYCSKVCFNKDYYKNNREVLIKQSKDYRNTNKGTIKVRAKQYREEHKEHIQEYSKEYYAKNKEEKKTKQKIYRLNNRDEINKKQRENYHKDIEESRQRKKEEYIKYKDRHKHYNNTHKEQRNARRRYKRITDPDYKVKEWCRATIRRCISKKTERTFKVLGYTSKELRMSLESQFKPDMTWENHGVVWHIDHIKPLDVFNFFNTDGSINYDIVREANALTNLRPLYVKDNLKKSSTWSLEDERDYQMDKNILIS